MVDEIERLEERFDFDTQSDMHRHIYRVGLREQRNPLMWRLKDRVVDWVSIMGIAAVMVFLAGAVGVFPMVDAAKFSVALVIVAMGMLGAFELGRVMLGMNELSVRLRDFVRRDKA